MFRFYLFCVEIMFLLCYKYVSTMLKLQNVNKFVYNFYYPILFLIIFAENLPNGILLQTEKNLCCAAKFFGNCRNL